jgi:hypothetical protein
MDILSKARGKTLRQRLSALTAARALWGLLGFIPFQYLLDPMVWHQISDRPYFHQFAFRVLHIHQVVITIRHNRRGNFQLQGSGGAIPFVALRLAVR